MTNLKWSRTRPSQPGWYWYRDDAPQQKILCILLAPDGRFKMTDRQNGGVMDVELHGGEWANPFEMYRTRP